MIFEILNPACTQKKYKSWVPSKVYRREVLLKESLFFDEELINGEDTLFNISVIDGLAEDEDLENDLVINPSALDYFTISHDGTAVTGISCCGLGSRSGSGSPPDILPLEFHEASNR